RKHWKDWGAVAICTLTTLYFFRQNLRGIHESSDKALKIMIITTVMAVIMLGWCALTLGVQGPANEVPLTPNLEPKNKYSVGADPVTGKFEEKEDPLGFISNTSTGEQLRNLGNEGGPSWLSLIGLIGIFVAFGHSILAMSGEETLAQVYREVESP